MRSWRGSVLFAVVLGGTAAGMLAWAAVEVAREPETVTLAEIADDGHIIMPDTFTRGDRGLDVMILQARLRELGYPVDVTGVYDRVTADVVDSLNMIIGYPGEEGVADYFLYRDLGLLDTERFARTWLACNRISTALAKAGVPKSRAEELMMMAMRATRCTVNARDGDKWGPWLLDYGNPAMRWIAGPKDKAVASPDSAVEVFLRYINHMERRGDD